MRKYRSWILFWDIPICNQKVSDMIPSYKPSLIAVWIIVGLVRDSHFSNVSRKSGFVFSSKGLHLITIVSWLTCCDHKHSPNRKWTSVQSMNNDWCWNVLLFHNRENRLMEMLWNRTCPVISNFNRVFLFIYSFNQIHTNTLFFFLPWLVVSFFNSCSACVSPSVRTLHIYLLFSPCHSLANSTMLYWECCPKSLNVARVVFNVLQF